MNDQNNQGQNQRREGQRRPPSPKPPITREEVTLIIGGERSFRPVVDGTVFLLGVQVTRRTDIRKLLFDYVPGWVSFPEEALNEEVSREKMHFIPRQWLAHDDMLEYVKLLTKAQTAVVLATANANKEHSGVLTHRLVFKGRKE